MIFIVDGILFCSTLPDDVRFCGFFRVIMATGSAAEPSGVEDEAIGIGMGTPAATTETKQCPEDGEISSDELSSFRCHFSKP